MLILPRILSEAYENRVFPIKVKCFRIRFLKPMTEVEVFNVEGRLFQTEAPLNPKLDSMRSILALGYIYLNLLDAFIIT